MPLMQYMHNKDAIALQLMPLNASAKLDFGALPTLLCRGRQPAAFRAPVAWNQAGLVTFRAAPLGFAPARLPRWPVAFRAPRPYDAPRVGLLCFRTRKRVIFGISMPMELFLKLMWHQRAKLKKKSDQRTSVIERPLTLAGGGQRTPFIVCVWYSRRKREICACVLSFSALFEFFLWKKECCFIVLFCKTSL